MPEAGSHGSHVAGLRLSALSILSRMVPIAYASKTPGHTPRSPVTSRKGVSWCVPVMSDVEDDGAQERPCPDMSAGDHPATVFSCSFVSPGQLPVSAASRTVNRYSKHD